MSLELEARRGKIRHLFRTAVDVEDSITGSATKMMVVVESGELITIRRSGELDDLEHAVAQEFLQSAIDGGDAEARNGLEREVQHLLGPERTRGVYEGFTNRIALLSLASHGLARVTHAL